MYIDGLKDYQAVYVEKAGYIVKLPYGNFTVNGQKVSNGFVAVDDLTNIKSITPSRMMLSHYDHGDGTIRIEIEYVESIIQAYEIDEDGNYIYADVEDQVKHIRDMAWVRSLTPIYTETEEVIKDVEIEVIGHLHDTGSDFIETSVQYGLAQWRSNGTGIYKVWLSKIARDEFDKVCKDNPDVKIENSTHSNIHYAQVNGKYIFTNEFNEWVKSPGSVRITNDLDDAKAMEKAVRDKVSKIMYTYINAQKPDAMTIVDIVTDLNSIKSKLNSIDPKQKSTRDKLTCHNMVTKLIEKLHGIE